MRRRDLSCSRVCCMVIGERGLGIVGLAPDMVMERGGGRVVLGGKRRVVEVGLENGFEPLEANQGKGVGVATGRLQTGWAIAGG